MWRLFSLILLELEKKGNGTFAAPSAAMIADETQPWLTPFHEILTTDSVGTRNGHEDFVRVAEVRKRSSCYHR